jgi:hypothetical protein
VDKREAGRVTSIRFTEADRAAIRRIARAWQAPSNSDAIKTAIHVVDIILAEKAA